MNVSEVRESRKPDLCEEKSVTVEEVKCAWGTCVRTTWLAWEEIHQNENIWQNVLEARELRKLDLQEKISNTLVSNKLDIALWTSIERIPKHAFGGEQIIRDTLLANFFTRHLHMIPKEEEDEASFLSFMIKMIIASFFLVLYDYV